MSQSKASAGASQTGVAGSGPNASNILQDPRYFWFYRTAPAYASQYESRPFALPADGCSLPQADMQYLPQQYKAGNRSSSASGQGSTATGQPMQASQGGAGKPIGAGQSGLVPSHL